MMYNSKGCWIQWVILLLAWNVLQGTNGFGQQQQQQRQQRRRRRELGSARTKINTPLVLCYSKSSTPNNNGSAGEIRNDHAVASSSAPWSPKGDLQPIVVDDNDDKTPVDRRQMVATLLGTLVAVSTTTTAPTKANAYDRRFPEELTDEDSAFGISLGARSTAKQRAQAAEVAKEANRRNLQVQTWKSEDGLGATLWGVALWFLLGSRSNPLATPLANLLYDPEEEEWLKDRNDGLFAPLPIGLFLVLGVVFLVLGGLTEFGLLQLAEGDSDVCIQLAGVSLIGGGALELGRIASGEKLVTRAEKDRFVLLREEFAEFANQRLNQGGNCHRQDIVAAFRRYYGKYRQADSEQYPLTDLEVEQLLRNWNIRENNGRADMTSGGFYYGIQVNKDADAFVR